MGQGEEMCGCYESKMGSEWKVVGRWVLFDGKSKCRRNLWLL